MVTPFAAFDVCWAGRGKQASDEVISVPELRPDESHDAILGLYRQRLDIQIGVADVEHILGLWKPA